MRSIALLQPNRTEPPEIRNNQGKKKVTHLFTVKQHLVSLCWFWFQHFIASRPSNPGKPTISSGKKNELTRKFCDFRLFFCSCDSFRGGQAGTNENEMDGRSRASSNMLMMYQIRMMTCITHTCIHTCAPQDAPKKPRERARISSSSYLHRACFFSQAARPDLFVSLR